MTFDEIMRAVMLAYGTFCIVLVVDEMRQTRRVAELEAAARGLLDAMTRFGPDDSGQLWDATQALRALVGDETTRSETTP